MSFRLVPKSVTLNGVMALFCISSANSRSFRADCVKAHVRCLPDEFLSGLGTVVMKCLWEGDWHTCICH